MTTEVKMVVFVLEHGPGYDTEGVLNRSEAEWEMSKLLSDGWQFLGTGGTTGTDELKHIGLGFALFQRQVAPIEDRPLRSE
jgi:hypothetical protein